MDRSSICGRIVTVFICMLFIIQPVSSYAWDGGHHDRWGGRHQQHQDRGRPHFALRVNYISREYVPVVAGGARYYYYDGVYYQPVGREYVLVNPPVGAVVSAIPYYYQSVVINGVNYYTQDGIYYVYNGYGYQVVPPPQIVSVRTVPAPVVMERASVENRTKVGEGALLGGLIGALAGGIVGHQMKGHHDFRGSVVGALLGASAGGVLGAQVPNPNYREETDVVSVVTTTPSNNAPVSEVPVTVTSRLGTSANSGLSQEAFPLNIPKAKGGGYVLVVIKRSGTGFVGPQGEYYSEYPKVAQLQTMYGN